MSIYLPNPVYWPAAPAAALAPGKVNPQNSAVAEGRMNRPQLHLPSATYKASESLTKT